MAWHGMAWPSTGFHSVLGDDSLSQVRATVLTQPVAHDCLARGLLTGARGVLPGTVSRCAMVKRRKGYILTEYLASVMLTTMAGTWA